MSVNNERLSVKKVKYDAQLLLKYVYDFKLKSTDNKPNIVKICRVKVKKTGGAVLAHYYAKLYLSNDFTFEFHPGSQPKTFQNINDGIDHTLFEIRILCDECCKKELTEYVEGENNFNIAFQNCETILCKRKSVQTVIGCVLLTVLIINIIKYDVLNMILIIFLLFLLYTVNNYMLKNPSVYYCEHMLKPEP
ncbi:PxORF86 peptide [Plutella xylostella granulovirus]|uniref:ORF84 protein n=1 Tax=Plutella xylostella granulovirus TaxID=98383 RepID=Q9DVU7_9BBAC|nr:PxORF86 peptide [Plutella xylostella granulovirus]AAG27384.1 PxORF86 peptide [Plutella xylostella granulovirus]AMQ36047.1 PxGV-Torf84 protein [Plutella xylostella granulovirus]ANY57605.1 PlxyGVORF86 protein [Plutella xylostella granulovirus]QKV50009.1 ORF84 protein [Plutella xylostella granulovirus]QKV50127.1 ORF84 protein [Plutella xylostella granulovirus]